MSRIRSAGDLRQLDRDALERARVHDEPLLVPGGGQHVLGGHDRLAGDLGQVLGALDRVPFGGVQAGADGGRPHVDRVEVLLRVAQELDLAFQRGREGVELLADRHGDRVLQLRAAHLDDLQVRVALGPEGRGELLQLRHQLVVAQDEGDLDRGGVRVVGGLRHVQVVVRLDDLVAALGVAGQLERDVGEHLVGVHVGGGAGAALVPVGAELVVVLAVPHGLAGLLDQGQLLFLHGPDVGVGSRRGELHDRPGLEEAGIVVRVHARDLEVLERPRRLHAVVGVRRDGLLSQEVLLDPRAGSCLRLGGRRHGSRTQHEEPQRRGQPLRVLHETSSFRRHGNRMSPSRITGTGWAKRTGAGSSKG